MSVQDRCAGSRGARQRLRTALTVLGVATLAIPWTGCSFAYVDSACRRFTAEDPLLNIHFVVWEEPPGVAPHPAASLHLFVGHGGEAWMAHTPKNPAQTRHRCRLLTAEDLTAVTQAVERLEHSVVPDRRVRRPDCLEITSIVLRGDLVLKSFEYCDTTPPAEVIRFVEEVVEPLGRRFGKDLAAGVAATAQWASQASSDPPGG